MLFAGVLLLKSSCFGSGDPHIRVGYGRKNLPLALDHLARYCEKRRARSGVNFP